MLQTGNCMNVLLAAIDSAPLLATTTTETFTDTSEEPTTSTTVTSPISADSTPAIGSSTQPPSPAVDITSTSVSDNSSANGSSTQPPPPEVITTRPTVSDNSSANGSSSQPPPPGVVTTKPTVSVPLPCEKNPCIFDAKCINQYQQYICRCPFGLYYVNASGCQKGKTFPGDLSLDNVQYNPSMEKENSTEYTQLYNNITQFFQNAFANETYKETIILRVKSSSSTLKRRRAAERTGFPVVLLINMFDLSTKLTNTDVQNRIQEALRDSIFNGSSFKTVRQCETPEINPCDSQTTDCTENNDGAVATCKCKPRLAKKNEQDTSCLLCDQCSQANNKQCIVKDGGIPQCQCMPNFFNKDGQCQVCDFGYSGENCQDSYVAIIVGVAVACGIVIVVLVAVLIYKSLRAKKKPNLERRSLLSNDYSARNPESKPATNITPTQKIFPKIRTKNPTDQGGQAINSGEGSVINMAYLPEQDYDDADPSTFEMATRSKF